LPPKAVLLAESFSGLVALTLLANGPARIAGVIFVGAFAEPPRPLLLRLAPLLSRSAGVMRSMPSFLLRQYCLGWHASAAQLKMLREATASVAPEVLAQRLALVASRHSFGKAPIEVPAYYIRPSQDRLVPASCAGWFQQRFRKCEIEEIEGPHFVLQAKPRESAQAIIGLVQRLAMNPSDRKDLGHP
jgi:pimeloyl-ACP methyl ester carboxylesterase